MAHFLVVKSRHPNAAQKSQIVKGLKTFYGDHLALAIDCQNGKPLMWVECPDNYGASGLEHRAQAVIDLVDRVMGK